MMTKELIDTLKSFASVENVSVEYYKDGKSYAFPVSRFVLTNEQIPMDEIDDTTLLCIDCSYVMQMNIPFVLCQITYDDDEVLLEEELIPFDKKLHNPHQRDLITLINYCSKKVIAQEMSGEQYALTSALNSVLSNKEYS